MTRRFERGGEIVRKGDDLVGWFHGSSTAPSFSILHSLIITAQSLLSPFMPLSPLTSL